jgi:hypothetical protein
MKKESMLQALRSGDERRTVLVTRRLAASSNGHLLGGS